MQRNNRHIILLFDGSLGLRFCCLLFGCLLVVFILGFPAWGMAQVGRFYGSEQLSSTMISSSAIDQDAEGYIWVGTEYGLNRYDGYHFFKFVHNPNDSTTLGHNLVSTLLCENDGQVWIGTAQGLDCYDVDRNAFLHFRFPAGISPRVTKILRTSNGQLLVGTAGYGLYTVDERSRKLTRVRDFTTAGDDVFYSNLFEDSKGNIWKCDANKGFTFNKMSTPGKSHRFVSTLGTPMAFAERDGEVLILCLHGMLVYRNGHIVQQSLTIDDDIVLRSMFQDKHGHIYIGTRGRGLYMLMPRSWRGEEVKFSQSDIDLSKSKVWSIFEDHQNNLWIGCQQKGLLMIPTIEPLFDTYSFSNQKQQIGTPVTAICKGDDGIVWCTVQGNGIYGFDLAGKIHSSHNAPKAVEMMYRDSKGKFWVTTDRALYVWQPTTDTYQQKAVFDCDKLNDMVDDRNGRLYLSTYSRGFAVYDTATGTFRSFSSSPSNSGKGSLHNNWIHKMFVDSSGLVWLATAAGVSCYHPVLDSFNSLGWNYLLDGTMCYALCETREGDMLIGTEQGLYTWHRQKNQVTKSPHAEVLCDKAVSYIAAESDGGIWCSTREGIWHYQPKQEKWVGYLRGNGLGSSDYVVAAGLQTDSTIYFGTADGITFLQPNRFKKSRSRLGRVYLTSFLIAGHRHATRGKTQFEIPYQTNSFTVDFSHFDFNNAENTVLEYRLNESPWTPLASGQNSISFNNLSSGVYNLEVRAVVNDQTSAVSNYTFIVTTPWYRTVYAYLGYAMLLGFIAAYLIKVYLREKRRQLENEKMKFLINTTHDIRSPLTLILSPLNKLKKKHAGAQGWEELELIEQNANKILALVNQILDMRKIDKQQMKLQCQETDIVGFVNSIYKMFAYNAKEHNINYTFHRPNDAVKAWIDHTQFDKVVSNLLSNAFKYTSDGGNIDVVVSNDDHFVRLSVTDDGIGIREDERKRVFDRFYQSAGSEAGTGIGLHLCKMIVDLHHGIIDVLAGYHGQGTTFEIRIPVGNQHLSADEIMPTIADATCGCRPNSQYRLLFVDDDIDLASFVVKELCRFYHIVHCINGREAMRKLNVEAYDIVVSDVMMPEMDGLTFLRTIKRNSMLNHLPVVLLTSQADVSNRLEGLEGGADGFLAKPFDIEELHTLIDNLLSNRLRLRGKFTGIQQQKVRVDKIELSSADDQLMERVMNAVNERISDSEFDVDALAHAVGLGRSQLYKRMKELTGLSVADFIRNIRLEQAARLIQENKVNISQVAYTVGFSSPAHFSTLFKRYFGVPPSEYVSKD